MANLSPKPTWAAALALFALFACVSLYKAVSGSPTCGCFGRVAVSPWYTAALDLGFVAALWRFCPADVALQSHGDALRRSGFLGTRLAGVFAAWLAVALPTGIAMANYTETTLSDAGQIIGDGNIVVLEPEKWIGKRFPLLHHIDVGSELERGEWMVAMYHHGCPTCQETLRALEAALEGAHSDTARVAFIEMPPFGRARSSRGCLCGRLEPAHRWFLATPAILQLRDATVTQFQSSE